MPVVADRQASFGEVARGGLSLPESLHDHLPARHGVTPGNYDAVEAVAIVGRARSSSGVVLSCQNPTVNVEVE